MTESLIILHGKNIKRQTTHSLTITFLNVSGWHKITPAPCFLMLTSQDSIHDDDTKLHNLQFIEEKACSLVILTHSIYFLTEVCCIS